MSTRKWRVKEYMRSRWVLFMQELESQGISDSVLQRNQLSILKYDIFIPIKAWKNCLRIFPSTKLYFLQSVYLETIRWHMLWRFARLLKRSYLLKFQPARNIYALFCLNLSGSTIT